MWLYKIIWITTDDFKLHQVAYNYMFWFMNIVYVYVWMLLICNVALLLTYMVDVEAHQLTLNNNLFQIMQIWCYVVWRKFVHDTVSCEYCKCCLFECMLYTVLFCESSCTILFWWSYGIYCYYVLHMLRTCVLYCQQWHKFEINAICEIYNYSWFEI